jgi:hypothetical protein
VKPNSRGPEGPAEQWRDVLGEVTFVGGEVARSRAEEGETTPARSVDHECRPQLTLDPIGLEEQPVTLAALEIAAGRFAQYAAVPRSLGQLDKGGSASFASASSAARSNARARVASFIFRWSHGQGPPQTPTNMA